MLYTHFEHYHLIHRSFRLYTCRVGIVTKNMNTHMKIALSWIKTSRTATLLRSWNITMRNNAPTLRTNTYSVTLSLHSLQY